MPYAKSFSDIIPSGDSITGRSHPVNCIMQIKIIFSEFFGKFGNWCDSYFCEHADIPTCLFGWRVWEPVGPDYIIHFAICAFRRAPGAINAACACRYTYNLISLCATYLETCKKYPGSHTDIT